MFSLDVSHQGSIACSVLCLLVASLIGTAELSFGQVTILKSARVRVSLTLEQVSGDNQAACINSALAEALKVKVVNKNGDGVAGATIAFKVDSKPSGATDGTFSSASVVTDANGEAETQYTVGDKPGEYKITATAADDEVETGSPQTFTATGVEVTLTRPVADLRVRFNSDAVGKLEIEHEATINPDNAATRAFLAGKIQFEVDAIGASTLTWDNPGGVAVYSGGAFKAIATFTGLPADNSDY